MSSNAISASDLSFLLPAAVTAARKAGEVIEEIRRRGDFEERVKQDNSPVTEADRAADSLLRRELTGIFAAGWLSEETADTRERLKRRHVWVVDPLDGTKEFIKGTPEYSVAIALVEDRRPVLGAVHNPASNDTFWAARGIGAFRNDIPIRVADAEHLLASRSELKRGEFAPFVDRWNVTPIGSIAYKLGLVAAGEGATLSRGPKWEWDVCAGALIVEEAGGRATDVFGRPLVFNQPFPKVRGILAGAPTTHGRLLAEAARIGPSDRMQELLARNVLTDRNANKLD